MLGEIEGCQQFWEGFHFSFLDLTLPIKEIKLKEKQKYQFRKEEKRPCVHFQEEKANPSIRIGDIINILYWTFSLLHLRMGLHIKWL